MVLIIAFWQGLAPAQTTSPLAGKTVHIYNPFGQSLPLINLSGVGHAMTPESGNWYLLAFDSLGGALQP